MNGLKFNLQFTRRVLKSYFIRNIVMKTFSLPKDVLTLFIFSLENGNAVFLVLYTDSQKHESTLLHTYVLSKFLTANHLCTTKYF